MTPVYQTLTTMPGQEGNCLEACFASLLDVPLSDVTSTEGRWLRDRHGLQYVELAFGQSMAILRLRLKLMIPDLHHVLIGRYRPTSHHAVIARNGVIVHDPATIDEPNPNLMPCDDGKYRIGMLVKCL